MTKHEWKKVLTMLERYGADRIELLDILKDGVSFVNRAAKPLGGNTLDQCRYMNRRFRIARMILERPAPKKRAPIR